jgi:very-short-patch-repair endonuclease
MLNRIRTTPKIQQRAKELRRDATPAEKILWEHLRNRQLGGFKFRRQAPMGNVIADFYCAERKLIVELDGDIHDFQVEEDAARSRQIESFGYRVIRFRNEDVEKKIGATLNSILEACKAPLPELGEGWGEGA